jgi:hypothetical protein
MGASLRELNLHRAHNTTYDYVLTPKQQEEFNAKYASILTGEQYLQALHTYERKHGYRVEEPRIN